MRLSRSAVIRLVVYPALPVLAVCAMWVVSINMPGKSWSAALPPLTPAQSQSADRLRAHVTMLAGRIGERNFTRPRALDSAATYMEAQLRALGYTIRRQEYQARGQTFRNIEATLPGLTRSGEIVLVGGHYDAIDVSPGADDNASGAAGVLEVARFFKDRRMSRTLKFVAFVNEEPPFFFTEDMGSLRYAREARAKGDTIVAMLSLETIGHYSDAPGSQRYPPLLGWFYPNRGNFVAIVGNIGSRGLVQHAVAYFREFTAFPSQGSAAPTQLPGISWSDHWAFWMAGYDAIMITDTAPFRNGNYHELSDRPETLNYDHMARVVEGVARVVGELATVPRI